jgi:bacteriocin-like protein
MSDPKVEKDQNSPDTLSQAGDGTGIELNENQLDSVSGGLLSGSKFSSDKL